MKTIFAESSVNAKVEEAIARESGAKVGKELWADSLGPEGSDGATYIGSIEANTRALVEGFTGRPRTASRCLTSPPPTSSAASSRSCCWR